MTQRDRSASRSALSDRSRGPFMHPDVPYRVGDRVNLLRVLVWDLDAKLLFKFHDQFRHVERIGVQIMDE